jgi:hypothetical protein
MAGNAIAVESTADAGSGLRKSIDLKFIDDAMQNSRPASLQGAFVAIRQQVCPILFLQRSMENIAFATTALSP